MKRDYDRIRNAIKATNKNRKVKDWLNTYREVLYDLMPLKTAVCDLEDAYKQLRAYVILCETHNRRCHMINHRRLNRIEKKLGIV